MDSLFLCVIPKHSVNVPPLSLGFLKGACMARGVSCTIRDFNIDLWEATIYTDKWYKIWQETNQALFMGSLFDEFCTEVYLDIINKWAAEIAACNSKFIGISCFSHRSLPSLRLLSTEIRRLAPEKKIIAGGAPMTDYGRHLIESGVADYVVISEGEIVLPGIVQGLYSEGIIETAQIENLDDLPFPDYTGLDITRYTGGSPTGEQVRTANFKRRAELGLIGSRGCVRKCTFCDVEAYWPKFKWRSADNLFAEMMHHNTVNGIDRFFFYDSLVNGNIKEFEKLLDLIIAAGSPFKSLQGLAIIKSMPERIFIKLKKARWLSMIIGVESFSEEVRTHMRKKFSNKSLDENLTFYKKYKIPVVLLMIVGYPGETEKNHKENFTWMQNNRHFAGNPIKQIEVGTTMLIFPGAPVFYENMFEYMADSTGNWVTKYKGEINNLMSRLRKRDDLVRWANDFGIGVESVYGTGGQVIGDIEHRDIVNKITNGEVSDPTIENMYTKTALGWESDPARPTHVHWIKPIH